MKHCPKCKSPLYVYINCQAQAKLLLTEKGREEEIGPYEILKFPSQMVRPGKHFPPILSYTSVLLEEDERITLFFDDIEENLYCNKCHSLISSPVEDECDEQD